MSGPTIVLAGGGSGGHLYPGIAVAEALRKMRPDTRVLFLCTNRPIDELILKPTGFEWIAQPVVPLRRTVGGMLKFWRGWRGSLDIAERVIRERKPAAVLGLGGYAAGVAVKLAGKRKIPAALLNPDVIPGRANQLLFSSVRHACCQFEQTRDHVSSGVKEKLAYTGCPIRADVIKSTEKSSARRSLGLEENRPTLLVTGASQGAVTVNEAVVRALETFPATDWQVLHLAGPEHAAAVQADYGRIGRAARVIDFTPAMGEVWSAADLAISRAGASSCAELTACGVPSILMPYPFHKDMHQLANAKVLRDAGAAVIVDDAKDAATNAARLLPAMKRLMSDAAERKKMADAAQRLGRPDAADRVAGLLLSYL